jgi:hypothetical protein
MHTLLSYVRTTPGISCERPICSTLVCFIPLFDGLVALPRVVGKLRQRSSQTRYGTMVTPCPIERTKGNGRPRVAGDTFALI